MPVDRQLFDPFVIGGACSRCRDLGLWMEPNGFVQPCPSSLDASTGHRDQTPSGKMIQRAIELLREKKLPVTSQVFQIAITIAQFSTETPCSRENLLSTFFTYLPMTHANQLRKFHSVIEELRKVWLLPVGSRKDTPSGYWIITDQKDFEEWFQRSKAAPITQLTTIHRVAKRNFPIFAEQLELEFFNDNDPPPTAVAA